MWIDSDTIIRAAAVLAAVLSIGGVAAAVIKFVVKMKSDEKTTAEAVAALEKKHDTDLKATNGELTVITYGILACLRGLKEQGCDGPVKDAIDKIEKHLNQKAHEAHE